MAKTNFKKVEESLDQGLRQIEIERLLDITDGVATAEQVSLRGQLLAFLQIELKSMLHKGHNLYQKFNIDKGELKKYAEDPMSLKAEDLEKLKKYKEQIDQFRVELAKSEPTVSDEDVVDAERRKHINKRFNTNEKWLPLR